MIYFIGAGPGDPELITVKGKRLIDEADIIIYAGPLVNPQVLSGARPEAEIYNSATMNLEEVLDVMKRGVAAGKKVVRVHTGDPSIYGAHREQMVELEKMGIPYEIVPGVLPGGCSQLKAGVHAAGSQPDRDLNPHGRTHCSAGAGTD